MDFTALTHDSPAWLKNLILASLGLAALVSIVASMKKLHVWSVLAIVTRELSKNGGSSVKDKVDTAAADSKKAVDQNEELLGLVREGVQDAKQAAKDATAAATKASHAAEKAGIAAENAAKAVIAAQKTAEQVAHCSLEIEQMKLEIHSLSRSDPPRVQT